VDEIFHQIPMHITAKRQTHIAQHFPTNVVLELGKLGVFVLSEL
jgi:hypothetical protein